MGVARLGVSVVLLALLGAPAASANEGPTVIVPGRAGVPVMWFGQDISWASIEGERGLDRPGNPITIIPAGRRVLWAPGAPGYFPSTGQAPPQGRDEEKGPPPGGPPPPAKSYHRSWDVWSAPAPATLPPDPNQPPVVVMPQIYGPPADNGRQPSAPSAPQR